MKERGYHRPLTGFKPIPMPKNTATGVILAGLCVGFAFGMIWYIWWLAALSFVAALAVGIGHTFNYNREYDLPADDIARAESERTRCSGRRHNMTSLAATGDAFVAPPDTTSAAHGAMTALQKSADAPSFYVLDEHPHPAGYSTLLGFWLYIMSDCLLFSVLFATYGVLGGNYAAGPSPKDLFDLPLVAVNTTMLLLSSITYGFAMLAMQDNRAGRTQIWLAVTAFFGLCFIGIELYEFADLIRQGATPQRSAFLSSFFTLVGTHGLHVTTGLVWMATLMVQVGQHGLIEANRRRLMCLSMFWHFLDVVWIGVFTFVYLMGMLR